MKYPLEVMYDIRKMRERAVEAELARAERALEEAVKNHEKKRQELKDYRRYRSMCVSRWWSQIRGIAVQLYKVEKIQLKIQKLYDAENEYIRRVNRADRQCKRARRKVNTIRNKLLQVTKNKLKLEEHRTIWMKTEEAEQIKHDEEEIEDLLLGKYIKQ